MKRKVLFGLATALLAIGVGGQVEAAKVPAFYLDCEVGCKPVPNISPPTRLDIWMNGGGSLAQIQARAASYGCVDLTYNPALYGAGRSYSFVLHHLVGEDCDY